MNSKRVLCPGPDAIRPFIVDPPNKIYENSKVDVDAMFTLCSDVSMNFSVPSIDVNSNIYFVFFLGFVGIHHFLFRLFGRSLQP